jgi:hypothetical protein
MRKFSLWLVVITFSAVSCSEKKKPALNPVGVWQNTTHWDNNAITLTVNPDSTMLFKAEKSFCPGTKFFVSWGKWHIENDTILVMEQFTDGRKKDLGELFPELIQTQRDSGNVIGLALSARLIIGDSLIHDVNPDGSASTERVYRKTSEIPAKAQ